MRAAVCSARGGRVEDGRAKFRGRQWSKWACGFASCTVPPLSLAKSVVMPGRAIATTGSMWRITRRTGSGSEPPRLQVHEQRLLGAFEASLYRCLDLHVFLLNGL